MKKIIKSLLVLTVLTMLVACGGSSGKAVKLGVASKQYAKVSAEDENEVEFTTVVVGVALVDDKVAHISIDESQQFAQADGDNVTMEKLATKKTRGAEYGMKALSEQIGIGLEWDEQVKGIEEALIGKNLEEVKAYFSGEEILTTATILVNDFEEVVIKAIEGAIEVKGVEKVGLGHYVDNMTHDEYASILDYAFVGVDKDGKIVEVLLDTAQEEAVYDGTWELRNVNKTKGELKEAYNMIIASPIQKEWYEQNNSLMDHFKGMTFDEVAQVTIDDEDIKSSVTMIIDGMKAAVADANNKLVTLK